MVLLQNIVTNNRELCNNEDRLIVIDEETIKLGETIRDKDKAIETLEKFVVIMENLTIELNNNSLNEDEAIEKLTYMKVCY